MNFCLTFILFLILTIQGHSCFALEFANPDGQEVPVLRPEIVLEHSKDVPHKTYSTETLVRREFPPNYKANVLSFEFGKLSETDFKKLQERYRGEKSVKYSPNRDYNLIDFLPRFIQATVNQRFRSEIFDVKDGKFMNMKSGHTYVTSNCWGTAYEFLRNDPKGFEVFMTDNSKIKPTFLDEANSKLVSELSQAKLKGPSSIRNKGMQFGDVLVISQFSSIPGREHEKGIMHVAIYIDDDIFFEKNGQGGENLYQIVELKSILESYPPHVYHLEFRSITKKPDIAPSSAFNVPSLMNGPPQGKPPADLSLFFNYRLDAGTGRYTLEPGAFNLDNRRQVPNSDDRHSKPNPKFH